MGAMGLWLHWRGGMTWCQPWEFFEWVELLAMVRRRLALAGLAAVAFASGVRADRPPWPTEYRRLYVEVTRLRAGTRGPRAGRGPGRRCGV